MSEQYLRGVLGFKGERGYSAYEIAVQNGFIGTEQDWLATLGTSSHLNRTSYVYSKIAEVALFNTTGIPLPTEYTSNSFIDIRINGLSLNSQEYSIDLNKKAVFLNGIELEEGTIVELVLFTMTTNNLPIVETINNNSTNEEAARSLGSL